MVRRGITLVSIVIFPFLAAAVPGTTTAPTPRECSGIPASEPLIDGLVTGQVVREDGATTLRFANHAYACGAWPNSMSSEPCETQWTFRLTLPVNELTTGSFDLADMGAHFGYVMSHGTPESGGGCSKEQCRTSVTGVGDATLNDGAILDVYSVSDGCITGKLSGVTAFESLPGPNVDGAFFALPCSN